MDDKIIDSILFSPTLGKDPSLELVSREKIISGLKPVDESCLGSNETTHRIKGFEGESPTRDFNNDLFESSSGTFEERFIPTYLINNFLFNYFEKPKMGRKILDSLFLKTMLIDYEPGLLRSIRENPDLMQILQTSSDNKNRFSVLGRYETDCVNYDFGPAIHRTIRPILLVPVVGISEKRVELANTIKNWQEENLKYQDFKKEDLFYSITLPGKHSEPIFFKSN